MNEEQKNIDTCLAENILSEVANVPTDPQFRSLVEESFDPLQQQALQQAGYDGYIKVAGTHQPYTFTSSVKQMKSNLILLLRRLWRFPFGRGTIRSLADMWQHYITRLKGNPEYGIPSRLDQLTDLPSAPALLADRKISGVPEAADGMSLVHLLNDTSAITELTDDNTGWTMTKALSIFPNVEKIILNASKCNGFEILFYNMQYLRDIELNYLTEIIFSSKFNNAVCSIIDNCPSIENLHIPHLRVHRRGSAPGYPSGYIAVRCANLKYITLEELVEFFNSNSYGGIVVNCENLRQLNIPSINPSSITYGSSFVECPCLYRINIGIATSSYSLVKWNPTMALRTDTDAEDYVDLREDMSFANNLQQFLQNFKSYIAERLTDNGSSMTLTLSQEVRDAIQQDPEIVSIITGKGWTISPAPSV